MTQYAPNNRQLITTASRANQPLMQQEKRGSQAKMVKLAIYCFTKSAQCFTSAVATWRHVVVHRHRGALALWRGESSLISSWGFVLYLRLNNAANTDTMNIFLSDIFSKIWECWVGTKLLHFTKSQTWIIAVFLTVHHSIELFHLPTLMHNSLFINNMYVTLLSLTCFEH